MQGKIGPTFVGVVVAVIVIAWLASDPPPKQVQVARASDRTSTGIELSGRLGYEGTRPQDSDSLALVEVRLRSAVTRREYIARRTANGRGYSFAGLEPGEYVLTTAPTPLLDAPVGGLPVTLAPSQRIVTLDLTLKSE